VYDAALPEMLFKELEIIKGSAVEVFNYLFTNEACSLASSVGG